MVRLGVFSRGLVVQGRMRASRIIVSRPGGDRDPVVGQVAEHGLVETFIAHPTFEAFDEPGLHRHAQRDVVPLDPVRGRQGDAERTGSGGAFKGLAMIGVGLIVLNEIRDFLEPETEGDWTDLFVGLAFEVTKMIVSSILGAAFAGFLVAMGLITGTFWVVIAVGAVASMAIGIIIDVQSEQRKVKDNIRDSVNDLQARTRDRELVNWAQ